MCISRGHTTSCVINITGHGCSLNSMRNWFCFLSSGFVLLQTFFILKMNSKSRGKGLLSNICINMYDNNKHLFLFDTY